MKIETQNIRICRCSEGSAQREIPSYKNTYIKKEKRSQTNNLNFHLQTRREKNKFNLKQAEKRKQ